VALKIFIWNLSHCTPRLRLKWGPGNVFWDPPTGFSWARQCYPAHQKYHYLWVECVKQQTYPSYGQRLVKIFASWKPKSPRGWPVQHHVLWHICLVLFSLLFLKVELASSVQSPLNVSPTLDDWKPVLVSESLLSMRVELGEWMKERWCQYATPLMRS